jgi:hypothetical protein
MVRVPRKRSWLWRLGMGITTIVGLSYGAGAYQYGSANPLDIWRGFALRNDPHVVAALPEQQQAVRDARAIQEKAVKAVKTLAERIETNYKVERSRADRTNRRVKGVILARLNDFIAAMMDAEFAFVRGDKEAMNNAFAGADAALGAAKAEIGNADPYKWSGGERANAQTQMGRLRTLLASIRAAY